jgi:VCBS repeat-containing protein
LNDRPSFTLDQTLLPELEDPTPTLRSYEIVRNITPGPALATDELSSQVVDRFQIRVVANHPNPNSLFTVLPQVVGSSVDTIRRLEYVLAPDINWIIAGGDLANTNGLGDIVLEIVAFDNGPTAPAGNVNESLMQRLTIRVTPVNDAPEFTIPGNHVSNEDAGLITVPGFATSIRSGTTTALDELLGSPTFGINPQTVEFIVESWDTNLFVSIPTISPNGTLVYQIRPDINRNYYNSVGVPGVTPVINPVVTVRLQDNGAFVAPDVNTSAIKSFTVVVNPVNDNPVPAVVTLPAVEDTTMTVLAGQLTGVARSGPIDEDLVENQEVRLTSILLRTVQGGVITPVSSADNSRILSFTYTPPANYFGADSVEYVVTDNGTDNGVLRELSTTGTLFFNVTGVNDPPTFTPGLDLTLPEDTPAFSLQWATNVSPGPANESDQTVSFEVSVINSTLFSPFFTVAPSISPTGVLSFTLAQDVNGVVLLQVTAVDSGPSGGPNNDNNRSAVHTLTLTVDAINDIPLFSLDNTLVEHIEDPTPALVQLPIVSGVFPSRGTALDELIAQSVSFELTVRSAVPNRFVIPPRIVGAGTARVLEYQLAPDVNRLNSGGDIVVDVQAVDSGSSVAPNVNRSTIIPLTIRIAEVNDPPEFELAFDSLTIAEDAPLQFLPQIYFDERPGPTTAVDEVDQTITRVATVPAGAEVLYAVLPRLNSNGDLEFQYAPDVNSNFDIILGIPNAFHIFLTATDDGRENGVLRPQSTTKTLTVDVTPVNDAPAYALSRNRVNVIEDEGLMNIDNFAINVRPAINATALDENNQVLTFDLVVSNPSLFDVSPTMDASGRLTFRTAPNQNGNSIITARLRDNGLAGPPPNSNLGPLLTFTIAVEAINDAPEFTMPSTLTVQEDQGVVSLPGFATGIRPGPESALDENRQVLTFQLVSADPGLFEVMPSMQADGTLTFRTRLNVNTNTPGINRVVQFQLRDNGAIAPSPNVNTSQIVEFTLDVTPVNDQPIPGSIRIPGAEDGFIEVGPGRDFDIDDILDVVEPGPIDENIEGQTLRMTQIERTTQRGGQILPVFDAGVIVSFRYVPPADLSGEDYVRYVVTDDGLPEASATGTITLDVQAVNDPPRFTAGPNVSLAEDSPGFRAAWATNIVAGPPSALDELSGPNAQTVSFQIVNYNVSFFSVAPAVSPSGELSFTLAKDVNGTTVVEIAAVDSGSNVAPNNNRSAIHRLTISVSAVNDAPSFNVGAAISVAEDSGAFDAAYVSSIVPAEGMNSTPPTGQDESGQAVSFIVTNNNNNLFAIQPSITSTGRLQFVPAPNAFGAVTVTVIAQDSGPSTAPNQNRSTPRTFQINITQVPDAPFAVTDRYSTSEDALLTIATPGLLSNDIDPDLPDDLLRVAPVGTIQTNLGATVVLNADGSFTYDPRNSARIQGLTTGQTDVDTFTYTVRDRTDLTSNIGTVSITVTGVNDAPVAVNDRFVVATGVPVNLAILDNDRDVDTPIDVGTVAIGILPLNGSVTILPSGRVQYTPRAGFVGEDSFSYRVRDSLGALSNEATVQVISGVSPRAADDSALTARNAPIEINLVQNDTAFSGSLDLSTLQIASGPDTGTVVILGNGIVRYTPAANFVGIGSFQYFLSDTNGIPSNLATVTVRVVSSLNQNPTNRFDVDNDGFVSPIDALILINDINKNGDRVLPANAPRPPYLDVDGDGSLSPLDVLSVVNFINDQGNSGSEGEGEGMQSLGWFETVEIMSPAKFAEVCDANLSLQIEREIGNYLASSLGDSIEMGPLQFLGDTEEDEEESVEDMLVAASNVDSGVPSILDDLFAADWS